MSSVINHVHTYVKYKKNKWHNKNLFKCNDPHCRHYEEKSLIEGKASLCNKCGLEFVLDYEALRRARPTCVACSGTKRGKELRAIRELLGGLTPVFEAEEVTPNEFPDPMGGVD